jgi:glycosyltransferase involved in cell wall biosynthesis
MKVGVVVDNELNNDKRVLREVEILKEGGYEISILCFGFNSKTYSTITGIDITRINIRKKLKNILFFILNSLPVYEWLWSSWIKKFIILNNIEVLHVHDLYMARAARNGIKKTGKTIPMILDLHENYPFAVTTYNWTKGLLRNMISRPDKWQKKEKDYLGCSDKFIVLSEEFRDDLITRYPYFSETSFCALPNVPDLLQMNSFRVNREIIPFKKGAPIIFYFGVIAERRGIFDALSAFNEIIENGHKVTFLLIGPVDKKDERRFYNILESAKTGLIIHLPWIDISELPSYLDISDICIAPFHKNPQHESGVANKIFDYMLGHKPVIASDCRPQQKLIEKHNCGIIYRNRKELVEAIITLVDNEDLRIELGNNGFNAIVNYYNTEKVKKKLITFYHDLESQKIK